MLFLEGSKSVLLSKGGGHGVWVFMLSLVCFVFLSL